MTGSDATPENEGSMKTLTMTAVIVAMLMAYPMRSSAALDPEQRKSIGSMTVGELQTAADEARNQKDYEQAIEYLQIAIRKEPKNELLYNKMGMTKWKKGDPRSARSDFQRATKLNPKYAEAFNNIGALDYTQNDLRSSVKFFKKAVALEETRATFHVNLGAAWFAQNKVDRAIAEYTRALQLDPQVLINSARAGIVAQIASPEERARYAYMLAKIYAQRGEVEDCLRCLKMAKEEGYRDLANVYKDQEFASLRHDVRLSEVVPPPSK